MAVRFDDSTDRLLRTSSLIDYNSTYTVMFWFRMSTDLNAISTLFEMNNNGASNLDSLRTDSTGTVLRVTVVNGGVGVDVDGSTISEGIWNHLTLLREDSDTVRLYLNGALDITNDHSDVEEIRAANTRMEFGARTSSNLSPCNGLVAGIKIWQVNLSLSEIKLEMWSTVPKSFGLLDSWYPCFSGSGERVRDYSKNGKNWTEGGTLTDEAGPPIRWGLEAAAQSFLTAPMIVGRLKYPFPLDGLGTFFRGMNG